MLTFNINSNCILKVPYTVKKKRALTESSIHSKKKKRALTYLCSKYSFWKIKLINNGTILLPSGLIKKKRIK
jgi:hypothetical protein